MSWTSYMLSMILCARKQVSKRRNWGQSNKLTFLHLILLIRRDSPWSVIILDFFIRFKMQQAFEFEMPNIWLLHAIKWEAVISSGTFLFSWSQPFEKGQFATCLLYGVYWKSFHILFFFLIFMLLALFLFLFLSILFFFLSNKKEKGKRTHLLSIYTGIFGSFDIHQFEISSLMNCIFS